jgi:L-Ala-D/L-Glu epimerase
MKIKYYSYELPFKYPFTTARGTKTHQPTFIIELEHFGIKGYGEAPAIPYYDVTIQGLIDLLEAKKTQIEAYHFNTPERFWHFLHHLIPNQHFLICALDMAAWDLYGKMKNKPLYELWNLTWNDQLETDYTIGIDTTEKVLEKMRDNPMPIYKVKVGMENDIAIIEAIRKESDAVIRVDANSGWSAEEAIEKIHQLKSLNIEFVEEPIERFQYGLMKTVFENTSLPLFADESCVVLKDVELCASCFHGINIKLTKCGGPSAALDIIKKARSVNLKIMLGCMNESTIGSAAMAHLSPLVDYIDMDGPLLLNEDIATGLSYNGAKFNVSDKPGLGIQFIG